jgi:hypothetical protein
LTDLSKANFWRDFSTREALYLGFCATFIVITRAVFRLHLHVTGHSMFFIMFFLLLGRGCVHKRGSATLVGLVAGIICVVLGMGKGGPLVIFRYVVPGLIVDLGAAVYLPLPSSYVASVIVGAIASAGSSVVIIIVDWLVGMETSLILAHAAVTSSMNVIFGGVGSALVPLVVRRLRANQLV